MNIACGIMYDNSGKILMGLRKENGPNPNYWEFPGGKIEQNETVSEAVIREIKEETNLTVVNPLYLGSIQHKYSHFGVNISLFIAFPKSIKSLSLNQQHLWIKIKNIMDYPLPKANHKMLDILKKLD